MRDEPQSPARVLYGNADAAARASSAYADGKPTGSDLALEFQRTEPRTLAGLLPAMFERAALFRAQWVGAWTYWLLALLCVLRRARAARRRAARRGS